MRKRVFCFIGIALLLTATVTAGWATEHPDAKKEGPVSLLVVFVPESKIPKTGKTYTTAHYIATFDEESDVIRFTVFPYNLAVNVTLKGTTKLKQLIQICSESGPQAVADAIQENFGIHIDYWILTNMMPVPPLVDAIGGIQLDVPDLSINKQAGYVKKLVGKPWVEVTRTGPQILSGVQAVGYLVDTTYGNPTIEEEENRFRERQEAFTRGVIAGLKGLQLTTGSLIEMIEGVLKGYYLTNIDIKGVLTLAGIDRKCFDNPPKHLFLPIEISTTKASNGWLSLKYTEADREAVLAFVGQ